MSRLPWGRPNDWIKFKFHSAGKPHGIGLGGLSKPPKQPRFGMAVKGGSTLDPP